MVDRADCDSDISRCSRGFVVMGNVSFNLCYPLPGQIIEVFARYNERDIKNI